MKCSTSAARLLPIAILALVALTGCQSSQSLAVKPVTHVATAPVPDTLAEKRAKRVADWKARIAERREALRTKAKERREARLKRVASLRTADVSTKRKKRARPSRMDDVLGSWSYLKRRDNKIIKQSKRNEGPKAISTPKGKYAALISKYAKQHGVPYRLARAVVQVESSFRANVTGGAGEIGLMQIKLSTARGMGYKGTRKQLYNPATNLYWGMKYLGKAHQLAGGTTCGTILRYNAGHYAKKMNPVSSRYCGRVRKILA